MKEVYVLPKRLKAAVLGGILLAVAAGMTLAVVLVYVRPEGLTNRTLFPALTIICDVWFSAAAAVYFSNALRRYQLRADGKGIMINCTLVPLGFIPWDNVQGIGYAAPTGVLDAVLEPEMNDLIITLRSVPEFTNNLNIFQRIYFSLRGGNLKISLSLCKGRGVEIANAVNGLLSESKKESGGA